MKRLLAFLLAFIFLLGVALSEEEAIPPVEEPIVEVQEEAEVVELIEEEEPPIEELPEEVAEAPPEELPIEEEEEQPEELVEEPVPEPEPEPIESEKEPSETPTEVEISEEILTTPTPEPPAIEEEEEEEPIVEETETEETIESEEVIVPEELVEIAEGDWGYVDPEMLPREVHISFLVEPRYFGDEATIIATLVNFRSDDRYTIYWQYCENIDAAEPTWQEIPGERGRTYSFIVTKENYLYGYRVLVEMEDE